MTLNGESQVPSEATRLMPLLTTRATIFIGTWNVWTMWETGKTSQITTEMRRYKLAVLGISETHWTQARQQRLNTGEMMLYFGHQKENAPHTQRAALMLSKQARNALVGWESHGSRIIKASFKTKKEGITMNVSQCYAPTNDINDDNKDRFYERLQSTIAKCSRKDLNILMEDLNAKLGIDNTGYEDIMGQHRLTGREKRKWGKIYKSMCIQQIGYRQHNISTQTYAQS
ncbi:Craniofacial development protein 2 [Schistosoma haematobium]|uniref:Craniofacial development protein 2 n=1 Tax=Schistosoma haematobium TaxID=6185 RepID=A0A922LKR8_SCHHA|nr:Craniofacial development protein 2 [Schistosoma haematobium]KAH9588046.1 Craniofacial development protein 2 [Schistosoma haematobium]